jgi:undecaprenol kinase
MAVSHHRNRNILRSFCCAGRGLWHVMRSERNARIHVAFAATVLLLAAWLGLNRTEWALLLVAITLVCAGELLNTVVERMVDMVTIEVHPLAQQAKDISAGAVLFASLAAVAIGLLVLGPHLWHRLETLFG